MKSNFILKFFLYTRRWCQCSSLSGYRWVLNPSYLEAKGAGGATSGQSEGTSTRWPGHFRQREEAGGLVGDPRHGAGPGSQVRSLSKELGHCGDGIRAAGDRVLWRVEVRQVLQLFLERQYILFGILLSALCALSHNLQSKREHEYVLETGWSLRNKLIYWIPWIFFLELSVILSVTSYLN